MAKKPKDSEVGRGRPTPDDVLRRMLNTPPKQHKPKPEPRPADKQKRGS